MIAGGTNPFSELQSYRIRQADANAAAAQQSDQFNTSLQARADENAQRVAENNRNQALGWLQYLIGTRRQQEMDKQALAQNAWARANAGVEQTFREKQLEQQAKIEKDRLNWHLGLAEDKEKATTLNLTARLLESALANGAAPESRKEIESVFPGLPKEIYDRAESVMQEKQARVMDASRILSLPARMSGFSKVMSEPAPQEDTNVSKLWGPLFPLGVLAYEAGRKNYKSPEVAPGLLERLAALNKEAPTLLRDPTLRGKISAEPMGWYRPSNDLRPAVDIFQPYLNKAKPAVEDGLPVRVLSPSGIKGTVPKGQLQQALNAGYTLIP